jgi:ATP-dependent DNA ligase
MTITDHPICDIHSHVIEDYDQSMISYPATADHCDICPHVVEDYDPSLIAYPCIAEPKYDGHRCLIGIDPISGQVIAQTRTGRNITDHLGHIISTLRSAIKRAGIAELIVLDGELIHPRGPREVTSICSSRTHLRDRYLRYVVYDLPLHPGSYLTRRAALHDLLWGACNPTVIMAEAYEVRSEIELRLYYQRCLHDGHEGIVIKNPDSVYDQPGTWLRLKPGIVF